MRVRHDSLSHPRVTRDSVKMASGLLLLTSLLTLSLQATAGTAKGSLRRVEESAFDDVSHLTRLTDRVSVANGSSSSSPSSPPDAACDVEDRRITLLEAAVTQAQSSVDYLRHHLIFLLAFLLLLLLLTLDLLCHKRGRRQRLRQRRQLLFQNSNDILVMTDLASEGGGLRQTE